ncbi:MAG: sodium-translocating pyrophosphatase [Candidatus Schekmanbacteria bacterium GWA2_38_9]|uniref:K(+)-insensitive pyrophosphate-energized proton pump n=1 Tax=Candidatus Schekmanbacteria bacterium RIFCSPLOWO2_12_FULL_38_15 TaxID=1817883 RepID=A0A1F7SL35_9BACT|nr:MAG: sodium-translocating pyrophosphatase [Candidatus Schekmanbacteria bacterium GWA2_38_9]OGL48019.1 MAG: sodium-translocating pyrophosphatase [Candidatus Schekmanbacteria bacterium RIFCSPLOWO2_02_FULL_38_14]OGL54496.1 MAG: sodium-translocating pyrophosphatase [Candidatus Schekmanbacteria bacterium RIFCSPLOWO2_12_FULL_38_15]
MLTILLIIIAISVISLAFAGYLTSYVFKQDCGTKEMQEISNAIKEGAEAFLRRQYKTIGLLSIVVAAALFLFYNYSSSPNITELGPSIALKVTFAFILGAACSAVAGFIGMFVSIRANIRAASAARESLNKALQIALRGGAVSGLAVVSMSLLGVGGLFYFYGGLDPDQYLVVPLQIVGFGFGASFVALFAQLGGGIFTKAADVGADLVGKVEAGIPEDDPRNPAVIADLVGDNVGDCAGRGADLFESTAAENIGAMILGIALYPIFGLGGIMFPLLARAFGLIATMVGVMVVKTKEDGDPMQALNRGYYVTTVIAMIGFYFAVQLLLPPGPGINNNWFFAAGVIGILTALSFVFITQYYTEFKYRPVKSIAEASRTGPATNIITGLAVSMECTAAPIIVMSAAIMAAYKCGQFALPGVTGAGLYGTAIATMGMLAPCAYILAMDTFGPITDNAGGIIEMSKQPEKIRQRTDKLDSVGNTTKALTKGYAIGSAGLAAFLLFRAYLDEVQKITHKVIQVDLSRVPVFVAGLLGAMLVFLFSALAIRAVGRAAYCIINEVRRQFKENPGIMKGTSKPNYGRCVDIVTIGALKEMVLPGIIAVLFPVSVGFSFKYLSSSGNIGAESVAALLMVGTITGILMATMMNNGGGAWDNAKKYIETGAFGGKGSDTHKAAVVGDTVGDPLKDTAGPSLHVLIKLLSTITLVLAPLFI